MRAVLRETGWNADLAVEPTGEPPAPVRDQVVVAVEACGVCHRDLIDRSGRFAFVRLPVVPGHEAVGRVTAVGPQATSGRSAIGSPPCTATTAAPARRASP